jgi:membrane protease YdiL (CAAX protease family)
MDTPYGWPDYLFIVWTVAIALAGVWYLFQGVAHPGTDRPRGAGHPAVSAFLSLMPMMVFFGCMGVAAILAGKYMSQLGGQTILAQGLASLLGQGSTILVMLWLTRFIPGSVRWAPTADEPASPPPLDGADEIRGALQAFKVRTALQAFLALMTLTIVASLLWKVFYFFCEQNGQTIPDDPQGLVQQVAGYDWSGPWRPMVVLALAIVVGAPIAEELVFRGMLYPSLKGWLPRGYAVVLTGVLFGAIHGNLASFLPLATLGGVLCLYRDRYGLLTCMSMHLLANLTTFFWLCFAPNAAMQS